MSISASSKAFVIESVGLDAAGRHARSATLSDGRFVVVWQETLTAPTDGFADTDGAVFARIYNRDGTAAGETIQVNAWLPGLQESPEVAATIDGGFRVSFDSTLVWGDGPKDVDSFVVTFDGNGVVKPVDYFDTGVFLPYGDIDPDNPGAPDSGSLLFDIGSGYTALLQEMSTKNNLTKMTLLGQDGVATAVAEGRDFVNFDLVSSVTLLDSGNVLIVGERNNFVVLQLSDPTLGNAPTGIPGVYGPVIFTALTAGSDAVDLKVTALHSGAVAPLASGGGFVLSALQPSGMNSSTLVLQSYTAWGALTGSNSISIAMPLSGPHPTYDVLAMNDGTFVVSWTTRGLNGQDVMAGHFDSNGSALGSYTVVQGEAVLGDQFDPSLSLLSDNSVLVTFTDLGNNPISGVVDTLHAATLTFSSISTKGVATSGADKIVGTSGHDGIDGLAGNDTINGYLGNDALYGGDGNDGLLGGLGDDALIGGLGNDNLAGGDGNDGLSGEAGADLLRGENGRDVLSGGSGADKLYGGADGDRLDGGTGNDILEGGTGADIFVFRRGGGNDQATDFAANDFLRLDHGLWASLGTLTTAEVLTRFAHVVGSDTVLTFAGGENITLQNFTALVAGDLQLI